MRSETVRTVRIRSGESRQETGSVSPPALTFPTDGKLIFVEKVRKLYGPDMDPELLETKIEQLWKGLTASQREKFIGKSGEKENAISTPPKLSPKPCMPVLERRNNCKAIARVLDLKSTKPSVPYSDIVKNRIKAYKNEGEMIVKRVMPMSPPNHRQTKLETPYEPLFVFEAPKSPEKPPQTPEITRPIPKKKRDEKFLLKFHEYLRLRSPRNM
uniref:HMG box domain-containing protein n=1 Tax=Caenorhabditis tropicalis TaxID=1561998 RepID=A0A1I7U303_9PELO